MSNGETQADIAREMRTYFQTKKRGNPEHRPWHQVLSDWADRIEAAAKRERGALVAEAEAAKDARNRVAVRLREEYAEKCRECKAKSGNAAAMREAIMAIKSVNDGRPHDAAGYEINDIIEEALAAPPRNCDVGTAEEQAERFDAFCQSNMQFYRDMFGHDDEGRLDGWDCSDDCPVGRMIDAGEAVADHCQLAWAQMPYKAEGGAE